MPVLSPAFRVLAYTSQKKGLALSLSQGKWKVDALLENQKVKWLDQEEDLSRYLVTIILNRNTPLLVRSLNFPLKKEGEIDKALPHEVEGLFPTPQGEIVYDRITLPLEGGKRKVTLLLTTKEGLQETLSPFQETGIEPEVVTAPPVALALAASFLSPVSAPRGVLYIDDQEGFFIVEQGGYLLGSVRLDLPLQKGSITRAIGALTRELGTPLVREILTFSEIKNLDIPSTYIRISPSPSLGLTDEELNKFILALGGALNSLVDTQGGIDFRMRVLPASLPWKRAMQPLAYFGGALLFALISLIIAGNAYLSWKGDQLKEEWAQTLSLLGKSEAIFEENYSEKTGYPKIALADLKPDQIATRAAFLQKELNTTPLLFPLHPNLPRVSDLLAWLASLSEVNGEEGRLEIVSLYYTLLKRPEMEKKQEKYQVKVDLEFTTPSPKWAREFHDFLINPNPFVDSKGEVKWNVSKGSYKTSFLLKDQTSYVQ
jgi:type IV pilus assembly protein PilM